MLSKKIKDLRIQKGLKIKELAEELRIQPTTLRSIEWGSYKPSYKMLVRIAAFFDINTNDLKDNK